MYKAFLQPVWLHYLFFKAYVLLFVHNYINVQEFFSFYCHMACQDYNQEPSRKVFSIAIVTAGLVRKEK